MKDTPSQKNLFTGKLDLDSEARSVADNDIVGGLNVRWGVSRNGNYQERQSMNGNVIVPYVQPTGTNISLGSHENLADRLNYSFIYNDAGLMQIRENNIDTNTVINIAQYNYQWQPDKYISNIDLVDNKLLFWTDTKPKRINIQKSRRDKIHTGRIYYASTVTPFAPVGTQISIAVFDGSGNQVAIAGFTILVPLDKKAYALAVTNFINLNFAGVMTAEQCYDYTEITFVPQGYFTLFVTVTAPVQGLYVPQNYYEAITDTVIDAGKYPLNCNPEVSIEQDNDRAGFNNIERTTWQFATQVVFDDYDESTLSPYSDLVFINCEQRGNYILIDYTDTRLNNAIDLSIIRSIRILARPNNTGKFRVVADIQQSELWNNSGTFGTNTYRFYNDGQYTVIENAEASLPYSAMPIEIIGDDYDMGEENADNRIMYSKFVENYDAPCIDATLTAAFTPYPKKNNKITINVRITNSEQIPTGGSFVRGYNGAIHQYSIDDSPVFGGACGRNVLTDIGVLTFGNMTQQMLASNGFIGFLAGTDYWGISKQIGTAVGVTFDSNNIIDTFSTATKDALRDWYVVNQAGTPNGDLYSVLSIDGVPDGKYVFRLASHWVSQGDKLGKGEIFDLTNGTAWQRTSTNVRSLQPSIDGVYSPIYNGTEIIIELNNGTITLSNFNGVLGSWVSATNTFFIGDIHVEDLCGTDTIISNDFMVFSNVGGYLIDGEGSFSFDDLRVSPTVEIQKVDVRYLVGSSPVPIGQTVYSDHNGYFYYKFFEVFGNASQVKVADAEYCDYGDNLEYLIVGDIQSRSALGALYSNPTLQGSANKTAIGSGAGLVRFHQEALVPASNDTFYQNNRTLVTGKVVDSGGTGLRDVPVVITRNNRNELTQSDGTFSILVYEDGIQGLDERILDQIIFNTSGCGILTFQNTNYIYDSYQLSITPIGVGGYNNTNPYAPAFLNNVVCSVVFFLNRKLKAGGHFPFALFHVDKLNRRHAIATEGLDIRIPFLTEQREDYFDNVGTGDSNGVFQFTLNITSPPPAWADKLYVCRTQDEYYSDHLVFPLFNAKYVVQYDNDTSTIVETSFSSFSANEIYLGFPKSTIVYKEFNSASTKGWSFQDGDRVRFINKLSGELYGQLYDFPIKAQRQDSVDESLYFAIDNLDALGEVTAGTLIEVYRPKKEVEDAVQLYWEIHTCIDIVNGAYVGLPLTINTGDTYTRTRTVPIDGGISVSFVEDNSISDNWISRQQDIGRALVKDLRFGRLERPTAVRFSNQYISGSKLNGLARFEPLNVVEFPKQYGAINKMILVNDDAERQVILAVCQNNSFTIYVGEVLYSDLRGQDVIALSNKVLGSYRTLKGDAGTHNPESFGWKDGQVFWWDINRGCYQRYDNNGVDDISQLGIQLYCLQIQNTTRVISAYDDYYSEFVTYPKQDGVDAIGFYSEKRGWNAPYSFKPEILGTSGEFLLSWLNGELYTHDRNTVANEFYGVKFPSKVKFVSKYTPLAIKIAQAIRVKASKVWEALSISTVPNATFKTGMLSRIKSGDFKLFEGDFYADIKGDINDARFTDPLQALLQGQRIRSDAFIVELQNNDDTIENIRSAEIYVVPSENTNV